VGAEGDIDLSDLLQAHGGHAEGACAPLETWRRGKEMAHWAPTGCTSVDIFMNPPLLSITERVFD
jgi:hypothetical protein